MSFSRYPEYKDSGVEWLGEVPAHWTLPKIKHMATFCGGGTPSREIAAYWNGDIPWVSPKDMKSERIMGAEESITDEGLTNSSSSLVAAGAALLVVRSGILKHTIPVAINDVPVALNQDMKAIRFAAGSCLSIFFLRWVQGLNDALLLAWAKQGATVESIEHDYFAEAILPLPPVREQVAIAAFLDRETAKIDALIVEQEKLIVLLKEKRQALISHAVTKGLDPNAPMKDSGIEWLGQVPSHWDVLPIKRDIAFITSGSRGWAEHYADDGELFLRIGNLTRETIDLDLTDMQRVSVPDGSEGARTKVVPGDVLFSITAYLGSIAVAPVGLEPAYVSQHIALVRLHQHRLLPRWVGYVTLSVIGKTYLAAQAYGGTKIQLGLDDVANLPVTAPSLEEQAAIVEFLDSATTNVDELVKQIKAAIGLLKERRAALISAAVTGKIDVRAVGAAETSTEPATA